MTIKIIIAIVVIILIVILVAYSDYIGWFFRLLKGEIKHNNNLNKLMNENRRDRYLKLNDIKKVVGDVDSKIRELDYPIKSEYILSSDLERKLRYTRYDDKSIHELFKSIYEFMGINGDDITFNIRRTSSRTQTPVAGSYDDKNKIVTLEISTYSTTDQIISTLSHELSHHILLSNGFELKDRGSNEIFTDITAIYMGFHKFFYRSYRDRSRIIYEGEFLELVDRRKLGYIGYKDVKYAAKFAKKLKNKKGTEQKNTNNKKTI